MGKQKKAKAKQSRRKAKTKANAKATHNIDNTRTIRTKAERQQEIATLLSKLSELQLTTAYEPIQIFYRHCKEYIQQGTRMTINIPFPEIQRTIVGVLATSLDEKVQITLQSTLSSS